MTNLFLSLMLLVENVPLGVRISKLSDSPFLMAPSGLQVRVTSLSLTLQKRGLVKSQSRTAELGFISESG